MSKELVPAEETEVVDWTENLKVARRGAAAVDILNLLHPIQPARYEVFLRRQDATPPIDSIAPDPDNGEVFTRYTGPVASLDQLADIEMRLSYIETPSRARKSS